MADDPTDEARARSELRHFVRNRLAAVRNAAFYLQKRTEPTALWRDDPRVAQFFALIIQELAEIEGALAGPPAAPAIAITAESDTRPLGVRVLLVDDHAGNRETLAALLADEGFLVDEAATFAEAVARLECAAPYEAVLLDRDLGDHAGNELVPLVRAIDTRTRVLVVTGSAEAHIPGVDAVIGKERQFEELLARLTALLRGP